MPRPTSLVHAVQQISESGGPSPRIELAFHYQRAQEYGETWVGVRRQANWNELTRDHSRLYLLDRSEPDPMTVLRGVIADCRDTPGEMGEELRALYGGSGEEWHWWKLVDVEMARVPIDDLQMVGNNGRPYDRQWLEKRQSFNYVKGNPAPRWEKGSPAHEWIDDLSPVDAASDDFVAPELVQPSHELTRRALSTSLAIDTICAVDWSGGGALGEVNPKLRLVRWLEPLGAGSRLEIAPATLSREAIRQEMASSRALWILDFPFGLPRPLTSTVEGGGKTLESVHTFTAKRQKRDFRDHCMKVWNESAPAGAKKTRRTEREVGGGWFAWFIQLFRQTWTGQVEVLQWLRQHHGDRLAILPWDHAKPDVSIRVVEGFPRATLNRLGLLRKGYKASSTAGRAHRQEIALGLRKQGLPITDHVLKDAVEDKSGDLLDALTMLLAGRDALRADHAALHAGMTERGDLGEGWIYC